MSQKRPFFATRIWCLKTLVLETPVCVIDLSWATGPIKSHVGTHPCCFPEPFDIAQRRGAKEPLVLAVEVRRIFVAHAIAGTGGVEVLAEHEPARFLQP